ncbi:matrin 3-like 1.1 isoform X2 [Archocentrus centrarchus]|uniref:matrin 3-like 1.1 isoform X2 n=1 Tax=Archocentrus centrarchus TaxID=63155 RepID=UPI0011E9DB19|nr:matrin-3-like isoform X2 [Archocentrus centrarchus]
MKLIQLLLTPRKPSNKTGNAQSVSPQLAIMSHNYPYRRPPSDTDLRPDPGSYRSVDYRHSSADHDFYRQPQDSFSTSASTSYTSSSSSRGSAPLQSSQEGVLNILSSCGLEPGDLALLAELPEDVLTVESLPHILRQIKCKKGTVKPFSSRAPSPPSSSFHSPSSTYRPATSSSSCSSRDWDQLNRPSVQYPLDHLPPPHPPSEQLLDRWGNPITVSSSRTAPLPSSSSSSPLGYTVDFHRRQGSSDYGKTGPVPSYSPGRREGAPPSRFSEAGPADYRAAAAAPPPSNEYKSKSHASRRDVSSTRSNQSSASMPTRKEALDFHGKVPPVFPYSCSLCDITVLSQKVWIQHVSGTQHADGQLSLLQQFPNWDCRMQTIRRDDKSEKKKKDGGRAAPAANQTSQSNRNSKQKKALEKGKVVCVKFPSQSVDETYLRKLTEPFGKIVKILMFPSLGFVEMGSVDQAKDLVKFHSNYPPTVNGEQIEFSISDAFNFLQSSRVVSFTPAPSGEHGKSDLISIVKRFGPPLYTLFLPSMAFVEMKNTPDAQKLVDYYQSNTLRLNDDLISVSFSGEYKTLMRVSKAKRYEEENEGTNKSSTKRTRSSSRDRDKSKENKKRRSRSRDKSSKEERTRSRSKDKSKEKSSSEAKTTSRSQEKSDRKRKSRTRSRSKDKSNSEKRTRTRSKSGSRDRTREKSTRESKTKSQEKKSGSRSRSRDKSREKSNKDQKIRSTSKANSSKESKTRSTTSKERKSRSRSRSMDKSSRDQKSRARQRSTSMSSRQDGEKTADPEKPESSSKDEPAPLEDSKPEVLDKQQEEEEAALPGEESDIEGMEVIAEDGENLKDEDVEALQEEEKITSAAEIAPEKDEAEEVAGGEPDNQENPVMEEKEEEEEESREATETQEESEDFPVNLENCITLDELGEDESDDQEGESADEPKSTSRSSRVFYFCHLPAHYALFDFFKLLRNFGRVVRYYLIGNRREGFIEMSSSSAALKAVEELTSNPAIHNCPKLITHISAKYYRLDNGWVVHSDGSDDEKNRSSSKKNEKQSKSKLSDQDENDRSSKGRKESLKKTSEKSGKKTPEKEVASKKTPERESSGKKTSKKEKDPKNTLENKFSGRKTPEKESPSKKTSDKDSVSASKKTPEKESKSKKTPKKESSEERTPEKDLKNSSEKESADRLTPEKGPSYDKIPENEMVEPKGTPEKNSVPLTTLKTEPEEENIQQNEELVAGEGPEEEKTKGAAEDHFRKKTPKAEKQEEQETLMEVCAEAGPDGEDTERPNPPDTSTDPPKAQREQEVEPQAGPAEGATEPQKPTKPVGTEFVRPVVGYFCNLCQLIFADEDEAKQQHCSSPTHYNKYQEKTGNDPWTS